MAVSPNHPRLNHLTGNEASTSAAIALLIHYFDLAPASAQLLVKKWLVNYPARWVRSAVTEALYQGRYKPVSVEQILAFWQRRGRSISHFNKEFETIIAVPLQGVLPSEVAEKETARQTTASSPAALDLESLTAGLNAAEQAQAELASAHVPRPRLMLPGELPGKELAQSASVQATPSTPEHHPSLSHEGADAQPNATDAQSPPVEATISQAPKGFEGILDSTPRPQVTQGPDSALVAGTKANAIQPPPIGPFTPATDQSGFSTRLKAVVQQAIARQAAQRQAAQDPAAQDPATQDPATQPSSQPAANVAQFSLGDAIKTEIASDPILGRTLGKDEPQPQATEEKDVLASEVTFRDAPALATEPAERPSEALGSTELPPNPVIHPLPLASEALANAALSEPDEPISQALAAKILESAPPASDLLSSQLRSPQDSELSTAMENADLAESEVQPAIGPKAAFEDRFALTHPPASPTDPSEHSRDEMDLEIDRALNQTLQDLPPDHGSDVPADQPPDEATAETESNSGLTDPSSLTDLEAPNLQLAPSSEPEPDR